MKIHYLITLGEIKMFKVDMHQFEEQAQAMMSIPSRIIYSNVHIPVDGNSERRHEPIIVSAIDARSKGTLMFQYNSFGTPKMVVIPTSPQILAELNFSIPENIFNQELASMLRKKFILPDTKLIDQISLCREYADGMERQEILLQWDANRVFNDFPGNIFHMILRFGDILAPFEDE